MKTATINKSGAAVTKQFRRILEQKSTELRSQLKGPALNPVLAAMGDPYDSGDWAEKSHEEWVFLQKNSADMELLRDIEDALDRLGDGTYGICGDCGITISRKRLDAVPWARFCITCQERRQTGNN
jgi:DnaK suppressor protein